MGIRICCRRLGFAIANHWLLVLWIIVNSIIFMKEYTKYKNDPRHFFLRRMIGRGLCVSRATAAMLNLSCCLVLLPMCRSFNLLLHRFLNSVSQSTFMFWLTRVRSIHIMCAITIILESGVHALAHIINAINFSKFYDMEHPILNWASYPGQSSWEMIFTSVVGITGVAMVLLLLAITSASLSCFRQKHYQIFWKMHHLYFPFFLVLLSHPLSGKLKELANPWNFTACNRLPETNTSLDHVSVYHIKNSRQNYTLCINEPVFKPMKSETWMWVLPPFMLLIIDRIYWSMKRNRKTLEVQQVRRLPGSVVRLVLPVPDKHFSCRPGQYILLQCPLISSVEWHPFSIESFCPAGTPCISVLLRARGDWTEALLGHVLVPFDAEQCSTELCDFISHKPVTFLIDGPFRSPLENVLNCSVAICIAAGIGITPFIPSFKYLLKSPVNLPRRLHLVWLLRRSEEIIWCAQLLCDLHEKFWQENSPDKFEICIHLTKELKEDGLLNDKLELLRRRLYKGRPDWERSFLQWEEMYRGLCLLSVNINCRTIKNIPSIFELVDEEIMIQLDFLHFYSHISLKNYNPLMFLLAAQEI